MATFSFFLHYFISDNFNPSFKRKKREITSYRLAGNELCHFFHDLGAIFMFKRVADRPQPHWILELSERSTEECSDLYLSLSALKLSNVSMYNIHIH